MSLLKEFDVHFWPRTACRPVDEDSDPESETMFSTEKERSCSAAEKTSISSLTTRLESVFAAYFAYMDA